MEERIVSHIKPTKVGPKGDKRPAATKVHVVRYADDFIITSRNRAMAERLYEECEKFLQERGLTLNRDKTLITKVEDGLDFLGFRIQNFSRRLKICPSPKAEARIRQKVREVLKEKQIPHAVVVKNLNPILRG